MLRTVLMAFFSLAVGYIILVVLIDGVLQDSFPAMIISLLMKFGMSQTEADRVYGRTKVSLWRWALSFCS